MQHKIIDNKTATDSTSNTHVKEADDQTQQTPDINPLIARIPRDLCFYLFSFMHEKEFSTLRALGSVNKLFYNYAKQYYLVPDSIYYAVGYQLTVVNGDRYDNMISRGIMNSIGRLFTPSFASLQDSINNQHTLYFTNQDDAKQFCYQTAFKTYYQHHDIYYIDSMAGVVAVKFNSRDVFSLNGINVKCDNNSLYTVFKTKPTNITYTSFAFFKDKEYKKDEKDLGNDKSKSCIIS